MHVPRPVAMQWCDIENDLPFTLQELLDDVEKLRERHRVCAVYVGGSRVDGYGNARSDVDVYALVDEPVVRLPGQGYVVSTLGHRQLQYDFVSSGFLADAIDQLTTASPDKVRLTSGDIKVLHRLCHAVAVAGGDVLHEYRQRVLAAGFVRLCAHRKAVECENGIQDAYGAWESGHVETAVYMLRTAVQLAFDALVSLCGETANNDKWIFPRSVRAFGHDHPLCLRFRSLYQRIPSEHNLDDVEQYFRSSFRFVQVCIDALCANGLTPQGLHGANGLSPLARHVLLGLDEAVPGRKSPHVYLRSIDGRVLLHDRGRPHQELSERAAVMWLCIVGTRGPAETARTAVALRPDLFRGEAEAQPLAEKVCRAWSGAGLLRF